MFPFMDGADHVLEQLVEILELVVVSERTESRFSALDDVSHVVRHDGYGARNAVSLSYQDDIEQHGFNDNDYNDRYEQQLVVGNYTLVRGYYMFQGFHVFFMFFHAFPYGYL